MVLDNFNLHIRQGGIYGLLGPNGTGKSTLLYLINGLLTPAAGSVLLAGHDTRLRQPSVLQQVVTVPEDLSLPSMPLSSFIRHYGAMYPNFDTNIMFQALDMFQMPHNIHLGALSMGQKKKVYISYALACNTPLLLMDEPTNGLDIQAKAAFRSLVAQLMTDERTIIISTHQVRDLEQLLDHILIMNQRRVLVDATVNHIQDRITFERNVTAEQASSALSKLPSPGGFDAMFVNTQGAVTDINLELLFDYALSNPEAVQQLLNTPAQ